MRPQVIVVMQFLRYATMHEAKMSLLKIMTFTLDRFVCVEFEMQVSSSHGFGTLKFGLDKTCGCGRMVPKPSHTFDHMLGNI